MKMEDVLAEAAFAEFGVDRPVGDICGEPEVSDNPLDEGLRAMGYTPEEIAAMLESAGDMPVESFEGGREVWMPTDLSGADWVLRKLRETEERAACLAEPYDAEIKRLEKALAETKSRKELAMAAFRRRADFFKLRYGPVLEDVITRQLEGSKTKSVKLPNGSMGFRKKPVSVEVFNDEIALGWAHDRGLTKIEEKLDKAAVKKWLKDGDAEAPQGMLVTGGDDEFYMKIKEAE